MAIAWSNVCLFWLTSNAEAAFSCRELVSTPKSFFVNVRASIQIRKAKNDFQREAVEQLRTANLYRKHLYRSVLAIDSEVQITTLKELISRGITDEKVWAGLEAIQSQSQKHALLYLVDSVPKWGIEYLQYLNDIQTPEQLDIFIGLVNSNTPVGFQFWNKLNAKRIRSDFANSISPDDIVAFSKLDGVSPSVSKELELIMLRFSRRDSVLAKIELLSNKNSYVLKDDSFYAKIEVRKKDDRLRIVVHEINVAANNLKFGQRTKGLNQDASEFMAIILLFAAKQAKQFPEIHEIEILAQNIVNINLARTLRNRLFHVERRSDIPNYSDFKPSGVYLRASMFRTPHEVTTLFNELTLNLMKAYGRDISPSKSAIEKFDNTYQYLAVRELLLKGENVSEIVSWILQFENWYQVRALQIMIDSNRQLKPSMSEIVNFKNEFQIQALNYAVSGTEPIVDMIDKIAQVKNQYQVNAIKLFVRNNKSLIATLDELLTLESYEDLQKIMDVNKIKIEN